jgi:hypothetical protein
MHRRILASALALFALAGVALGGNFQGTFRKLEDGKLTLKAFIKKGEFKDMVFSVDDKTEFFRKSGVPGKGDVKSDKATFEKVMKDNLKESPFLVVTVNDDDKGTPPKATRIVYPAFRKK